jgi:hypothetical protein
MGTVLTVFIVDNETTRTVPPIRKWFSEYPTKSTPHGFRQRDSGCVYPATSGQCAVAPTLKPVALAMGGS